MQNLLLFFASKPSRDGGSKSEKRCQDAFNNAYERAEHAIFRVQVGVCLSLELWFRPRRGAYFQKNEGLNLDCIEKSRKRKGRKIKKSKNQEIWSIKKIKGASRPAHVQIIYIFARSFVYLLCGPDVARRHSEVHPTRKIGFLLNKIVHRFTRMCFLLERGVHSDKRTVLVHIRTKRDWKVPMLKKH